jgi:TolB-like protein/class 3 adenylate cyclase/Tfp pilus assembly protein PilF
MARERVKRRLAAIVVADVVGYSRLMELDEVGTLAVLKERRKTIIEPMVRAHGGRVVKVMGDGVLVEFASAVDAVAGALDLQRKMEAANAASPDSQPIVLRLGINIGDVIGEGSDIYGEGVNIAARLEALAEPGGICMSAKVHHEVRGKVDAAFEDGGERELKNIAAPVRIYHLRIGHATSSISATQPAAAASTRPSIAVLPLVNMSGDPEQQYFSDGITEDIITELSRFRQMHVVSRNSSSRFRGTDIDMVRAGRELGVRYLVEGSVRRMGARTRITAQLIDATTGTHIWAERYDAAQDEIFEIQDRVVRTIVGTLAGRMNAAAADWAKRKPPASLEAYDCVLRGDALPIGPPASEAEARALFEKAIDLDPGYARAYALLAFALEREWFRDMSGSDSLREESLAMARKAVALDDNDATCHLAIGWAHVNRRSYELAEQHFAKALALNPNHPVVQSDIAQFYICRGEPEKAIEGLKEARQLDPFFTPFWFWGEMGTAQFVAGRYDEAIESMRKSPALSSGQQSILAASYAKAGKLDLARQCTVDLLRSAPDFSSRLYVAKLSLMRASDAQNLADGLRQAGLPE